MLTNFGWDFPPGVSGNEYEIAGYPECPQCDLPYDPTFTDIYGDLRCENCGHWLIAGPDSDDGLKP